MGEILEEPKVDPGYVPEVSDTPVAYVPPEGNEEPEVFGGIRITLYGSMAKLTPGDNPDSMTFENTAERDSEQTLIQARNWLQALKAAIEKGAQ